MYVIPPVIYTAVATAAAAMIPKALSDAYDYLFGGETIQVRKKPDRTVLSVENYAILHSHYLRYLDDSSIYGTQAEFTASMNTVLKMNKSVGQMMRACVISGEKVN